MSAGTKATLAYVGLGSNLGASQDVLVHAITTLAQTDGCTVLSQSSFWRSAPIDAQGPDYINAVITLLTELDPVDLLLKLQSVETQFGRQRPYPNAPRTLDLDLLWMDGVTLQTPQLTLPHPRLHQRAFVVFPLAQVAPNLCIAGLGKIADWQVQTQNQIITQL